MTQPNLERYFRALEAEMRLKAGRDTVASLTHQYLDGQADAYERMAKLASEGRLPTDTPPVDATVNSNNER